jgi:hypothetical protein
MCDCLFLLFLPASQWAHALHLPGMHKKGVTCFAGRMVSDTAAILASTSSDGVVVIWEMTIEPTADGKMAIVWQMFYSRIIIVLSYDLEL